MSKVDTLKSYVPYFLSESIVFHEIYNSQGSECDSIATAMAEILDQCYIDTTTWGLKVWEKFLSLPIDESKDTSYRRSIIKAKIRGVGTVTKQMLQNSIKSFPGGAAEIIEDNLNYKFTIKFSDYYRVPDDSSITEIYAITKELKPAHLDFNHTFTYNWWGMDDIGTWNDGGTWNDLRNYTEV